MGLIGLIPNILNAVPSIAGVFSDEYREDQIKLAQAQAQGYATVAEMERAQNKPNYTLYIVIGVIVIAGIYLYTRKKKK
jgi:LPXTG-motif cell wall-anchored protein